MQLTDGELLTRLKAALPQLEEKLAVIQDRGQYEDLMYRFYHSSFKVFWCQGHTQEIWDLFRDLVPGRELNAQFVEIMRAGTGHEFDIQRSNKNWSAETRPIIEAFLHAKYMLEMAVKYARELDGAPQWLGSGWAAILCLYDIR